MQTGKKLSLQSTDNLNKASDEIKILAHPIRLRIMDILSQGEFSVHEIAKLCDVSDPVACDHLMLLKRNGFLVSNRESRNVIYRIKSKEVPEFLKFLNELFK